MSTDDLNIESCTSADMHRAELEMVLKMLWHRGAHLEDYEKERLAKFGEDELTEERRQLLRDERINIPAGSTCKPCRWCNTLIFWVPSGVAHYNESVSIAGRECYAPTDDVRGVGFSHMSDCPKSSLRIRRPYGRPGWLQDHIDATRRTYDPIRRSA